MQTSAPLVSVVTPVYNGGKYLDECIESVIAQSYGNWEYIIVNNCSIDNTLEVIQKHLSKDSRIRAVNNDRFVGVIENYNNAFRQISSESKYCKVVSADDWIFPECIERLVQVAETKPSIGVVQSYVINANEVRWPGFNVNKTVFDGREIARRYLLGKAYLTAPSANLYRSSLIRSGDPFFPGTRNSADAEACLACLQHCDFGFVHQILSFERLHDESVTANSESDSYLLDRIELLREYGPIFLTKKEMENRLEEMLHYYYSALAAALINRRGKEYWKLHKLRLAAIEMQLYDARLGKAVVTKFLDLLLNPKQTLERGLKRVTRTSNGGRSAITLEKSEIRCLAGKAGSDGSVS
jgi:glycosyltransferase involved in cell wall biosynthesis